MSQVHWAAHPHLFFTADKWPAIKAKAMHPRFRRDWEALEYQAEQDLKTAPIVKEEDHERLWNAARRAERCAFVYKMTGDARYGARARAFFDALLKVENWTYHPHDNLFGQNPSGLCQQMALAYDLLADEMSPDEKARIVDACRRKLIDVFLADCKAPGSEYLGGTRAMNHLGVRASAAGNLLLALDGDGVDFSKEIEIARAHTLRFVEWYDDAGASLEIGGYWTYGMGNSLRHLAALRENGWPEIFKQRSGKLARNAYPLLMMSIGGKFVTNFSDSTYGVLLSGAGNRAAAQTHGREFRLNPGFDPRIVEHSARPATLILAAEFQDPRIQWYADQMTQGGELALIFGDADLPDTPPDDLPTCVAWHGPGVGILRTSMSDPDARFLGLKAGRARGHVYDDPHCQFDLNSVIVDGYATTLLADPGYMHVWGGTMDVLDPTHISNSTPPHNTLLVNGQGQSHVYSPIAHLQDLSPSDDVDYLVSRIERGYGPPMRFFDRHAYQVAKEFYVLVDDIALSAPAALTWNWHAVKEATLTAGAVGRIVNGGAEVAIVPFGPAPIACRMATDHALPRLEWTTAGPTPSLRMGWLLLVGRQGRTPADVTARFEGGTVIVERGGRTWTLPVVGRRADWRSDIMAPFPAADARLKSIRRS